MQLHPELGNHACGNRQRTDSSRHHHHQRRQNIRPQKICRTTSKNRHTPKPRFTQQIRLDQWGTCGTPEVWRSDRLSIKPRDRNKDKRHIKTFHDAPKGKYLKQKEIKAKTILSFEHPIRRVDKYTYLVRSQTGQGWYKTQYNGREWVCDCPDNIKNSHLGPCKHLIALETFLESLEHPYVLGNQESLTERCTYGQEWPLYNMAQVQEFELFDQFLYQLIDTIPEPPQQVKRGHPELCLHDQIFCCVMKVYSQLSSRRAHHLYNDAMQRQQLHHVPHFNCVSKTLNKKETQQLLQRLIRESARPLASIETKFAVDSSGFRCSTFGKYCEEKHRTKRQRNWLKAHILVGVNTNIVADVIITDEHVADSPQLKKLLINTAKHFTIQEVSADLAYSGKKNLEIIDKLGGKPYIPFKKGVTGRARGSALWRKTFHYFQYQKDDFLEHYHKRSNVESTFGAIKKKFGESVKSKNRVAQENELLCKIIAYNITVLIHEMIQLNGHTDFLIYNGLQKEISIK